jgi:hypothetical protein
MGIAQQAAAGNQRRPLLRVHWSALHPLEPNPLDTSRFSLRHPLSSSIRSIFVSGDNR